MLRAASEAPHRIDRAEKMPLYASVGVAYAWLVSPRERTLEAYRLETGRWSQLAVHKDDERVRIQPFDAIELDLALLWADVALPTRAGEGTADYEHAD